MAINALLTHEKKANYFTTYEDIKIFWRYINKHCSSKWCTMFAISILRGIRIGEIVAINLCDFIDQDYKELEVVVEKTYVRDNFPLIRELSDYIKIYIEKNKHTFKDGYLFPFYSKKHEGHSHIDTKTADAWFCKIRKELIKEYPQFGDKTKHTTTTYKMLFLLSNQNERDVKKIARALRMNNRQAFFLYSRLTKEGYIGYNGVTDKGIYYVKNFKYKYRYRISWHSFRRFFTTQLRDNKVDYEDISRIRRDEDNRTVFTYLNSYDTWKHEREILNKSFGKLARDLLNMHPDQTKLGDF